MLKYTCIQCKFSFTVQSPHDAIAEMNDHLDNSDCFREGEEFYVEEVF